MSDLDRTNVRRFAPEFAASEDALDPDAPPKVFRRPVPGRMHGAGCIK